MPYLAKILSAVLVSGGPLRLGLSALKGRSKLTPVPEAVLQNPLSHCTKATINNDEKTILQKV